MAARLASLAGLLGFAFVALSVELAPIGRMLAPDLTFCVVAIWALRRPAWTPAWATLAVGLLRDLLSGGPVGAGALGLLFAAEGLRRHSAVARRRGFPVACGIAALWGAVATLTPWALLTLTLSPTPPMSDLIVRVGATALAFPPMALALRWTAPTGPATKGVGNGLLYERRI